MRRLQKLDADDKEELAAADKEAATPAHLIASSSTPSADGVFCVR